MLSPEGSQIQTSLQKPVLYCYKGREGTRSLTRAAPSGGWNDAPTVLLAIIIISIIKDQTYSCILSSGGGVTDPEHEPGASERLQNAAAGVNGNSLSLNNVRTDSATHKIFPVARMTILTTV